MTEENVRFVVTPGVGQTFFSPEQLALIGAAASPGGRVELNPFMQLIVHTTPAGLAERQEGLRAAGLHLYPAGAVVKNLQTCTFCAGEKAEGLPDARRLDQAIAGIDVPFPVRVGFSGCAANCAEARMRDIGVVRVENDAYDIYLGGRPGGLNPLVGERVAQAVPSERLIPVMQQILAVYKETAKGKERLWKNLARVSLAHYQARIEHGS